MEPGGHPNQLSFHLHAEVSAPDPLSHVVWGRECCPGSAPDNPLPRRAGDPRSHGSRLILGHSEHSPNSSKRVLDWDYCTELQALGDAAARVLFRSSSSEPITGFQVQSQHWSPRAAISYLQLTLTFTFVVPMGSSSFSSCRFT